MFDSKHLIKREYLSTNIEIHGARPCSLAGCYGKYITIVTKTGIAGYEILGDNMRFLSRFSLTHFTGVVTRGKTWLLRLTNVSGNVAW